MTAYMFPHSWPQEEQRLRAMSEMLDPHTLLRIDRLGLAQGWRCLELGAGNGSVSRALSERVGAAGKVVAVDLDTSFLDSSEAPALEPRQADVVDIEFEPAAYNLAYTRALLHHLPQWRDVVAKMAAALEPGGALLIQEPDIHPAEALEPGDWREFWIGFRDWARATGVDYRLGRKIAPYLAESGFDDVQAAAETIQFNGGSGPALFYKLSMLKIRDQLTAKGHVDRGLFDRVMALLDDPGHWGVCISFVAVSAKKPG